MRYLQARGLLQRNPDPADRRRHAVALTATGAVLLAELRHAAEDAEEWLLTPLSASERRTLHKLLTKLFMASTAA